MSSISHIPNHIAIIMDGNGRWAKQRRLPRLAGHRAGTENIRPVIECFAEHQVKCLTLFAFSTENWNRPPKEVTGLLHILEKMIDRETKNLYEKGIKLQHLGRLDELSPGLQQAVQHAIELMGKNRVDGVYNADPLKDPKAQKFDELTHIDAIRLRLQVMDSTALSLCMENKLPIIVFALESPNSILQAVAGEPIGTRVST